LNFISYQKWTNENIAEHFNIWNYFFIRTYI
jgi:hypothetical protein